MNNIELNQKYLDEKLYDAYEIFIFGIDNVCI